MVIFPESRNTKHNLALIYDATNEWVKSDKLYTELISSDSLDAQAYNNFAYSLVERKENLDLALEHVAGQLNHQVFNTLPFIYIYIYKLYLIKGSPFSP